MRSASRLPALAGFLSGFIVGTTWYFTDQIRREALLPGQPRRLDLRVLEVRDGVIELDAGGRRGRHGDWRQPGIWGIETERAYGRVGEIIESHQSHVRRHFEPVQGQMEPGDAARLDAFVYRGDPRSARGLEFEDVVVPAPIGPLPAWYVPASNRDWVIFVHGRAAGREESLRFLPVLHALGFPTLTVSYRNDAGAPRGPSGYFRYGLEEWQDIEAAVAFALEAGAQSVVLYGFSMGGSISLSFAYQSSLRRHLAAIVLDSPMLDLNATLAHGAAQHHVPPPFTALARRISAIRFGIEWERLDYVRHAAELNCPILLVQSTEDHYTPVPPSDALARARPDLVTYFRTPLGGHTRVWNADPAVYEGKLAAFLSTIAARAG